MTDDVARPTCCAHPLLRWRGTSLADAWIECLSCGFTLEDEGQLADWLNREPMTGAHEPAEE
jgi:hypothetical protein